MNRASVIVVGAGVGGLSAAALLAAKGLDVQVLERGPQPGGKLRAVELGGRRLDAGPTVLTMRWVFDALFDALGLVLDDQLSLQRCTVLARHAWGPGPANQLDLLADLEASVDAIATFSSAAEARRYRAFCHRAQGIFSTLDQPFLRSPRPNPVSLAWRVGLGRLPDLVKITPFRSLWHALGGYFHDPRLQQLFGRYATYCGSSPFTAPATLMLVAHVEREAVWQVTGGMQALAQALAGAARQQGVHIDCGQAVQEIRLHQGRACGVVLASGEQLDADVVLFNGDAAALHAGLLGQPLQAALGSAPALQPSLSALTWHLEAQASGFELSHHNVFFSDPADHGYRREFDAIAAGRLPASPTVYVCAQDRSGALLPPGQPAPVGPERLMCLVNAPAQRAGRGLRTEEITACDTQLWAQLRRAGLDLQPTAHPVLLTRPADFAARYPGTGGALYGPSSQGWRASFQRPGQRSRVPGLFLAGGSTHPGPGVPMAALSGQLAATQILTALASTHRLHPVVMPGGMSTR